MFFMVRSLRFYIYRVVWKIIFILIIGLKTVKEYFRILNW